MAAVERQLTAQGKLENRRAEVISAFAKGYPWSQIETMFACSRASLGAFHTKHKAEIEALKSRVRDRVEDVALRDKAERIRELAWMYDGIRTELRDRGFMWEEPHGENRTVLRMPTGAIKEARGLLEDIAAELGERSDKGADAGGTFVLIRERIVDRGAVLEPLG